MKTGTISQEVVRGILCYVVCSAFMLIANKVVITFIPFPALVFCIQLASAVVFCLIFKALGLMEVDEFTIERVTGFAPYICLFVISVYCNGRALARSNAETVIVFRASTPLFVSAMDVAFLGRSFPTRRSLLSLCGVIFGAVGYMQADSEFQMNGVSAYFWVIVYTIAIVLEMTYGKLLLSKVKLDTPVWGSVLFTNGLGLPPMIVLFATCGELNQIQNSEVDFHLGALECLALAFSCGIGVGIGWSGWNCRSLISATSFTLVGVVCKLLTVIVNVLIWNKHASPTGLLWLLVCLISSSLYRQAPLREVEAAPTSTNTHLATEKLELIVGVSTEQVPAVASGDPKEGWL